MQALITLLCVALAVAFMIRKARAVTQGKSGCSGCAVSGSCGKSLLSNCKDSLHTANLPKKNHSQ